MPKEIQRQITLGLIIFIFALGLRLLYVNTAVVDHPIRADAQKYYTIAKNLLDKGSYSYETSSDPALTTSIMPGYPLFLAAILSLDRNDPLATYFMTLNIQAVLGAVTVLLAYLIGILFLPTWAALLTGVLMACSPHLVVGCGYLLTETLFTFLLVLALFLAAYANKRKSTWLFLVFGLVAGIAALARPAVFLFPIFIAAGIYLAPELKSIRTKAASYILVSVLVVWLPWSIWKYQVASSALAEPSPMAASLALGGYPDLIFKDPRLRGFPYREDPEYMYMTKSTGNAITTIIRRAGKEPMEYLSWYAIGKPLTYWSWNILVGQGGPFIYPVTSSIYHKYYSAYATVWFARITHPLWLIAAFVSIIYVLVRVIKRKEIDNDLFVITILTSGLVYFTAVHTVLAPLPRYSIPLHPVLYLAGMYGIWKIGIFCKNTFIRRKLTHEAS